MATKPKTLEQIAKPSGTPKRKPAQGTKAQPGYLKIQPVKRKKTQGTLRTQPVARYSQVKKNKKKGTSKHKPTTGVFRPSATRAPAIRRTAIASSGKGGTPPRPRLRQSSATNTRTSPVRSSGKPASAYRPTGNLKSTRQLSNTARAPVRQLIKTASEAERRRKSTKTYGKTPAQQAALDRRRNANRLNKRSSARR